MGALKYFLTGIIIWFIGSVFFGSSLNFIARSEPAQLYVSDVQSRKDTDGLRTYRPVFTVMTSPHDFAGNRWSRTPPHQIGETVAGRYDPATGEMRSDKMLRKSKWLGWIARIFGALLGLQGIALLLGVPEHRLPIPVRIGHPRR